MLSQNIPYAVPNTAAPHVAATVTSAAVLLSSLVTLQADTRFIVVTVEAAPIRICPTGTVPTTTLGTYIEIGDSIQLSRGEVDVARVIRAGGTNATIQVAQYK